MSINEFLLKRARAVHKTPCFLCAPHTNTRTVTAFFIQDKKNSELPCHFLDFIKHTQTFQHWVSYLHVITAYWYSTKGNIPSSVKKITMKQSKIILAEVPELKKKKVTFLIWWNTYQTAVNSSHLSRCNLTANTEKQKSTDSFSKFLKRMLIPSSLNGSTVSEKDSVNWPCYIANSLLFGFFFLFLFCSKFLQSWYLASLNLLQFCLSI